MIAINYRTRTMMVEKSAKILFNKGVAAQRSGLYREAISYYKSALKLDPLFRQSFINLGILYIKGKKYDRAKICLTKAFKLGEDSALYFNLASLEYKMGNPGKAVVMLEHLLRSEPDHIPANLLLAQVHESAGRTSSAERHLLRVLEIEPDNKKALGTMALFYHDRDQDEKALAMLDRLLRNNPDLGDMKELRAALRLKLNKVAAALQDYQQMAASNPGFTQFTGEMGRIKEDSDGLGEELAQKISGGQAAVHAKIKALKESGQPVDKATLKEMLDLSFYHLFNGDSDQSLKYLFAAKKLGNDAKDGK